MSAKYTPGEAESRYEQLRMTRDIVLGRAKECAKYTLPFLFITEEDAEIKKVQLPWNDVGAEGVNNLASKLLLTLFPPNAPFFRIVVDDTVFEEEQRPEAKTAVEEALSKYERRILSSVEADGDRVRAFEAVINLLVGGNVLLHVASDGMKVFTLPHYVVRRDRAGNVLEIVVKESVSPKTLTEELQRRYKSPLVKSETDDKTVDIYTHIKRAPDKWAIYQEAEGKKIPGTDGHEPLDSPTWIPVRMIGVSGQDYGRSYVETYLGDLKSLDGLSEAILEGSVAAARVLLMVSPNGTTSLKAIAEAKNLDVIEGNQEEVHTLQLEKSHDFQVAAAQIEKLERRIEKSFLMHSSYQRQGERVTAEEIRRMAQDLEDSLGGVYSMLSLEFQQTYLKAKIARLEKKGVLPTLPKEITKPAIITGLEALGRGHERSRLVMYVQTLKETYGEQILGILNPNEYARRLAAADGVDVEGLLKTEEEQQEEQEQAQQQQLIQQLAPEAINQMGGQQSQPQPIEGV